MPTWRAKVEHPTDGTLNAEVEADSGYQARKHIHAIYGNVRSVHSLRRVNKQGSAASSDETSVGGVILIVGIVAAAWAFVTFAPWILMGLGGAAGAWIGEKVTGQSLEKYSEREDNKGHVRAAVVVALALVLGGFGFVKGDEFKRGLNTDSPTRQPVTIKSSERLHRPESPTDSPAVVNPSEAEEKSNPSTLPSPVESTTHEPMHLDKPQEKQPVSPINVMPPSIQDYNSAEPPIKSAAESQEEPNSSSNNE